MAYVISDACVSLEHVKANVQLVRFLRAKDST